jgi:hypothetical protein
MQPFEKCPACGGDLVEKDVEKVLHGGVNTACPGLSALWEKAVLSGNYEKV